MILLNVLTSLLYIEIYFISFANQLVGFPFQLKHRFKGHPSAAPKGRRTSPPSPQPRQTRGRSAISPARAHLLTTSLASYIPYGPACREKQMGVSPLRRGRAPLFLGWLQPERVYPHSPDSPRTRSARLVRQPPSTTSRSTIAVATR